MLTHVVLIGGAVVSRLTGDGIGFLLAIVAAKTFMDLRAHRRMHARSWPDGHGAL